MKTPTDDHERRGDHQRWRTSRRAVRRGAGRTTRRTGTRPVGRQGSTRRRSSTARQPFNSARSSAVAPGRRAQDRHDDAEADHDLGGGHDQHEEHGRLAVDVVRAAPAKVTKVRFTALSISSMHMNITSGLRRTRSPTAPMENSSADSSRYQVGVDGGDHEPAPPARGRSRVRARRTWRRRTRRGRAAGRARTVPTTAMISSTDVSSKANTWSLNRLVASCWMLASADRLPSLSRPGDAEPLPG